MKNLYQFGGDQWKSENFAYFCRFYVRPISILSPWNPGSVYFPSDFHASFPNFGLLKSDWLIVIFAHSVRRV